MEDEQQILDYGEKKMKIRNWTRRKQNNHWNHTQLILQLPRSRNQKLISQLLCLTSTYLTKPWAVSHPQTVLTYFWIKEPFQSQFERHLSHLNLTDLHSIYPEGQQTEKNHHFQSTCSLAYITHYCWQHQYRQKDHSLCVTYSTLLLSMAIIKCMSIFLVL